MSESVRTVGRKTLKQGAEIECRSLEYLTTNHKVFLLAICTIGSASRMLFSDLYVSEKEIRLEFALTTNAI